jgi:hypothetical protein
MRGEQWFKLFENNMLRKIFGLKREELILSCRRMHYEGLHEFYVLFNKYYCAYQIRKNEVGGTCSKYDRG